MRLGAVTLCAIGAITSMACGAKEPQQPPLCRDRLSEESLTKRLATFRDPHQGPGSGGVVLMVSEGTPEAAPLKDASARLRKVGPRSPMPGADSAAVTDQSGLVTWAREHAGRYEVVVWKAGYVPMFHSHLVRGGFVDTLLMKMRIARVCRP